MLVNLLIMVYIGQREPFKTKLLNRAELFNESFIYLVTYMLVFFTDFCPFVEMRYNAGWFYIALNVTNIAFRFGGVFFNNLKWCRLYWIKYARKTGCSKVFDPIIDCFKPI